MRNPFRLKKKPALPWGEEDTLGATNYLTPEGVVKAAKLIKRGKTYALGTVVSGDFPGYGERSFELRIQPSGDGSGEPLGANKATWHETQTSGSQGFGTHLDALGHFGIDHHYYNGRTSQEIYGPLGLQTLGIDGVPPIVTRGILLDMAAYHGEDVVPLGTAFNKEEIVGACARQEVTLEEGDVVLFHTGWLAKAYTDPEGFLEGAPGLGKEGADYLANLGIVAIGADTWSLEVVPWENEKEFAPIHGHLLSQHGIHILENVDTSALAADKVHQFFFTLGAPRLKGAGEAMCNPIAIC